MALITGEGFEIIANVAQDMVSLDLYCTRCRKWTEDFGLAHCVVVSLEEINRLADAHEHVCPEVA